MIFVTGDKHAQIEPFINNSDFKNVKKGDIVIVCGDFGFLWDKSEQEYKKLKWLSKRKYYIAFIDGCYDNMQIIEQYPVSIWNGGRARIISNNIIYLMQGELYNIEGKKVLAFGGGFDSNLNFNLEENNWWPEKLNNKQSVDVVIKNIEKSNGEVDLIVSHEAPSSMTPCFEEEKNSNAINQILEEIQLHCKFKMWCFGKYHIDKHITKRFYAVFDGLVKIG